MLKISYVPALPRVAGRAPPESHALINEMRFRGRLGQVRPPVSLHDGETCRHLERQLVVSGRKNLHSTQQLVRWGSSGTWRAGWPRAAGLDGKPRSAKVFTRRLEIVSPLVGDHRLVLGWSRLVARLLGGGQ
jgi:hypothetical protein